MAYTTNPNLPHVRMGFQKHIPEYIHYYNYERPHMALYGFRDENTSEKPIY